MAKKAKCPSCGSGFIKGKHVLRITTDGAVRQRVCQPCASLATLVLASDAPARCEICKVALARACLSCVANHLYDEKLAAKLAERTQQAKATPEEWQ